MSAPAIIDVEALFQPIPGEAPAGVPLADTLRLQLDDLRKEPDPLDPTTANRKSDWPQIIKLCTETLTKTSKDLIAAVRLMEAVTKKDGIAGVRDGLKLITRLIRDASDRLHPRPDEGESFEVWEGAMKWINDIARGGQFPATVGRVPIAVIQGTAFSFEDCLKADRRAELEELLGKTKQKSEIMRAMYGDWLQVRENLKELAKALDERMGAEVAPDMLSAETSGNLGNAVNQCIELIEQIAKKVGITLVDAPAETKTAAASSANEDAGHSGDNHAVGVASTREGLYRQLGDIADKLERLEPHSPIPMLLRRCVRLGALPFSQLIREMVRDANTLDELDRLLGTQKPGG